MHNIRAILLFALVFGAGGCARGQSLSDNPPARPGQQLAHSLRTTIERVVFIPYLIHLPATYDLEPDYRWPVIMYLHGGSLRGENVDTVRVWGLPKLVDTDPTFPFIVVSPQTGSGTLWTDTDALAAVVTHILATYRADPDRVYLTGHSMGGNGTWYLAYQQTQLFAAIAPMSAPANPWWASRLRDLPIWVFHGSDDDIVPPRLSEDMVAALKAAGNTKVRYTVLPDRGHGLLDLYEQPDAELYGWFLEHRRRD